MNLKVIDNSWYLAFFRVAVCLLLIFNLLPQLFNVSDIYHIEGFSYATNSVKILRFVRSNIILFFCFYIISLILYILGIGKQITGILVFVFVTIHYYIMIPAVAWGDEILRISILFLAFTDSFKYFALNKSKEPRNLVYTLAVLSIMIHICYVYFSNAYYKIENEEWQTGFAVGYFLVSTSDVNIFDVGLFTIKYPWLIKMLSWFVLLFQLLFPALVWFKKTKYPIIIVGVLLHLAMIFIAHLYLFELIVILHFGFFISNQEWNEIISRISIKNYGKRR